MSTTAQLLLTPISTTAQAVTNKRPVEAVIFTPVTSILAFAVIDNVPVVIVKDCPLTVTSTFVKADSSPKDIFNKLVDKVKLASPLIVKLPTFEVIIFVKISTLAFAVVLTELTVEFNKFVEALTIAFPTTSSSPNEIFI